MYVPGIQTKHPWKNPKKIVLNFPENLLNNQATHLAPCDLENFVENGNFGRGYKCGGFKFNLFIVKVVFLNLDALSWFLQSYIH